MASRNSNFTLLFFLLALLMANSCFSLPLAPNVDLGDEETGTSTSTQPAEEPTTTSAAGTDESTTTESSTESTTSEPYPSQVVENTDSTAVSTDEPTTTAAEEPSTTTAVEQTESTTTAVGAADEPAAVTDESSTTTVESTTTTEQPSESTPTTEAAESTTVDAREANLESTFHAIDSNGDEELSPEEVFDFLSQRKMLSKSQAQRALNSEAFQEFLRSIDQDQDGQLSLAEVRPVVENYANYEDAIMKVVFEMVDEDNDGLINYEEFIDAYAERSGLDYEQRNELSHNETSRQEFARMDTNGDEGIDLDELKASLKGSPESAVTSSTEASTTPDSEEPSSTDEPSSSPSSTTPEEPPAPRRSLTDFIFAAVDQDFNGQISYNEQIDFLATLLYDSYRQRDDLAKDESALRQFYGADRDNNGELNFEEFMAQIVPQQQPVDEPTTTTEQAEDDVTKQLEMLTQYFRTADADRNGQLDVDEFADFFAIAMRLPEEQKELLSQSPFLQQLFQQVDEDQNGGISLFELTNAFAGNDQQQSEQLAQVAFALVDADQDGCVTVDEAAGFAAQMTGTDKDQWLQDPRLREAFQQVDTDGDDRVSFDEWMEAVKNNDQQQQEQQSVSKFNLKAALFAF